MKNYRYILKGLDCANCAKKIEDKIVKTEGYKDVNVNFSTLKLSFKIDNEKSDNEVKKEITKIVKSLEPEVEVIEENVKDEKAERDSNDILRILIGIVIYAVFSYLKLITEIEIVGLIISLIILLSKTTKKAFVQITKNKVLDENMLITISVVGACLVNKSAEAVMVITLYEIGKILEARAVNKARKSISELMDIKPEYANKKTGEEVKKVNPEKVEIGDIILIKTGEKIPLDGTVIKGEAEIDNSALTGESKLIQVKEKSRVLSGGINVQGLIEVQVEEKYENSTVNQILNLVENATDKKAQTETFVAKSAKIYTPIVIALAMIVAIFMPIIIKDITYRESIYKALVFLVISCPCSIAISVPLAYFSGIGKASKNGILVKGSNYLDNIKDIGQIIFDKTGTITTGNFIVKETISLNLNYDETQILEYFFIGESFSNHPIAQSILNRCKGEINTKEVLEFQEFAGKGLQYKYKNEIIKIGNASLVGIEKELKKDETILYLKKEDEIIGKIILTDEIKKDAKKTIKKLSDRGIKTKMLTGDKEEVADKIAKEIGIKEVKAELLPQDKYNELEKILQNNKTGKKVAYVGDGINDSPVLARADIGISMGGIGSSSAIEASDIVIMTDELEKITEAIQISKKTNKIIKENLVFSIGVKLLILTLSLFGVADMWEAVFADVGTTLITIFNTIRIVK